MKKQTKMIRSYTNTSFQYTIGNIDVFCDKQFHPNYEIYFLLNGNVEFISDHIRTKLEPFNVVVIPPGKYHHFAVAEDCVSSYERCVLNIYPEHLEKTVINEALADKGILDLSRDHRIAKNMMYLKEIMDSCSEKDFEYILSAVATDIIFLIKHYDSPMQQPCNSFSHPLSCEIMKYINEHYKSNLSLCDVAKHFCFSVSSISHTFKDDFGISIKKYITEKRMNEIHLRLKNGEKPLELSEEFGFCNYSTFYRCYCKYFGMPPSRSKKN